MGYSRTGRRTKSSDARVQPRRVTCPKRLRAELGDRQDEAAMLARCEAMWGSAPASKSSTVRECRISRN